MKTVTEGLQFILRFAQMDLDAFRPGDWLNVRDDLSDFLHMAAWTGSVKPVFQHPWPGELPEADLRALQSEILTMLRDLLESREMKVAAGQNIAICAQYFLVGGGHDPADYNALGVIGPT